MKMKKNNQHQHKEKNGIVYAIIRSRQLDLQTQCKQLKLRVLSPYFDCNK